MNPQACTLRGQLKCWQFRADSQEPVPRWVLSLLCWGDGSKPELAVTDGDGDEFIPMRDGDWLVVGLSIITFNVTEVIISAADFEQHFTIDPPSQV